MQGSVVGEAGFFVVFKAVLLCEAVFEHFGWEVSTAGLADLAASDTGSQGLPQGHQGKAKGHREVEKAAQQGSVKTCQSEPVLEERFLESAAGICFGFPSFSHE